MRARRLAICMAALLLGAAAPARYDHPFQNPDLPVAMRVANLISLMNVDEKIDALSTSSGVPRLGVPSFGSTEGIHGLQQRGNPERGWPGSKTTQFPQPPGMGATWDPALVREAGGVEGYEARWITQSGDGKHPILMAWGPQADLARDPRWGRAEGL